MHGTATTMRGKIEGGAPRVTVRFSILAAGERGTVQTVVLRARTGRRQEPARDHEDIRPRKISKQVHEPVESFFFHESAGREHDFLSNRYAQLGAYARGSTFDDRA